MLKKRFDGVIEAVRFSRNRQIDFVRIYERRGASFSDCILLNRRELIKQLENGKHFVTGQRKKYLAGTFDVDRSIRIFQSNDSQVVTTSDKCPIHDDLDGIPIL